MELEIYPTLANEPTPLSDMLNEGIKQQIHVLSSKETENIEWWSDTDDWDMDYNNDDVFNHHDTDGACTLDTESLYEKFKRLECYFKKSCAQHLVNSATLNADEECKLYGMIQQGNYGDNTGSWPQWSYTKQLQHRCWNAEKGKTMMEAQLEFIVEAERILRRKKDWEAKIDDP